MKIHELLEARKNPELNPKVSINSAAQQFGFKFGTKNSFMSFTSVDKLGINPESKHHTPLGIYAYPLEYVLREIGEHAAPTHVLPYGSNRPYATLFTAGPKNIVFLSSFTKSDLDALVKRAKAVYPGGRFEIEDALEWATGWALSKTPGGIMWAFTMELAETITPEAKTRLGWLTSKIAKIAGKSTPQRSKKHMIRWNKVFRDLGIDGVVDDGGENIIHSNEPIQAVFFKKPGVINNERRVYNKYSPDAKAKRSNNQFKQNTEPK